ncbi:MAG TPA: hypothetical protein VEQ40_14285 [Pyrinomonadaceae bacterium]|nr:hypothetical protein [Pyrinomonadaceae bacterium]
MFVSICCLFEQTFEHQYLALVLRFMVGQMMQHPAQATSIVRSRLSTVRLTFIYASSFAVV